MQVNLKGKTTILKSISNENIQQIKPTEGFNIKSLKIGDSQITLWDLGGQKALREFWSNYYSKVNAIIYVVDSADTDRIDEAGFELKSLLDQNELSNVPILVFANKQDLIHAAEPDFIMEKLHLQNIRDRKWMIMACSAISKEGLEEGFDWIVDNIKKTH